MQIATPLNVPPHRIPGVCLVVCSVRGGPPCTPSWWRRCGARAPAPIGALRLGFASRTNSNRGPLQTCKAQCVSLSLGLDRRCGSITYGVGAQSVLTGAAPLTRRPSNGLLMLIRLCTRASRGGSSACATNSACSAVAAGSRCTMIVHSGPFALHRGVHVWCTCVVVRWWCDAVRCNACHASDLIKRYMREYIAGD